MTNTWYSDDEFNKTKQTVTRTREKLTPDIKGRVMLGWDGFVDIIWQPVSERKGFEEYRLMDSMLELAARIKEAAGSGLSTEIVSKDRRGGGFTVNTGRAINKLRVESYLYGLYGENNILPSFAELKSDSSTLISYGGPCYSHIFEFKDGKLMFPSSENINRVDWSELSEKIGINKLEEIIRKVDIIGLGYWSNMIAFDSILTEIYHIIGNHSGKKRIFIDPGHIEKRSGDDLLKSFNVFDDITDKLDITVSMNRQELMRTASILGIDIDDFKEIPDQLDAIRKIMNINELIVHTPELSSVNRDQLTGVVRQIVCENPVKTAGAGDTFNGGYISSMLFSKDPVIRLLAATATARYYVENGFPPQRMQLQEYLNIYEREDTVYVNDSERNFE